MTDDTSPSGPRRHSEAEEPALIVDPTLLAEAEAANGLRQFDYAMRVIEAVSNDQPFKLRPSLIQAIHREALSGISAYAGNWRPANVGIKGSAHSPVGAHLVAELIEDMCDYINSNWHSKSPIHLAAYAMWRLNWIHPFSDGNGRTSRIVSYVVLCARIGERLVGRKTIPDHIVENRTPYFEALEAADLAFKENVIDVSQMEKLLEALLAKQLVEVYERAQGAKPSSD